MTLEEKKLPLGFTIDSVIVNAIQSQTKEEKLPCARAFAIANEMNVAPSLVGQTADALAIHLSRCQLGLFGYPGKKGWAENVLADVPEPVALESAIRKVAADTGQLTCRQAWDIAAQLNISKMQVGYAADQMEVRIVACQLGAF
ncbi:MAG: hypothetical protein JXA33_18995 [Anaerolineae bacterium]|nr:hypothetical protein [Anaerolineae bacterium]